MSELERLALKIWQDREMELPPRVRRMRPDDFDRVSGAWSRVLLQAQAKLSESATRDVKGETE